MGKKRKLPASSAKGAKRPKYEPEKRVPGSREDVALVSREGFAVLDKDESKGTVFVVHKLTLERSDLGILRRPFHFDDFGFSAFSTMRQRRCNCLKTY